MSSFPSTERASAITQKLQELAAAAGTSGLSVGVVSNGKHIYTSHSGYQSVTTQEAPNDDTVYHLGSLTKAITAAGMAVLVEEGKFKWDSLLKDVVPGFHQRNEDVEALATITDLLSHRMGLAMRMNYWAQMEQELLHPPEKAIDILGALGKLADFRTTLKYNNWTYAVAGLIIEHYSGTTLEGFMQKHFFEPLNLKRTTFGTPTPDNYAGCHITLSDGMPFEVPRPMISSGTLMGGAAGLKSSLGDLLTLYTTLLEAVEDQKKTGETSTPGNPFKQTAMMFEPHGKKGATEYGLGWFLTELPGEIGWIGINDGRVAKNPIIARGCAATPLAYHNGSMPGALSSVHLLQQKKIAIVALSNTLSFADVPDYVGGLLLEEILDYDQPTDFLTLINEAKNASIQGPLKTAQKLQADQQLGTSHKPLEAYEGRYVNANGLFLLDVKVHGEGLRMHVQGLPKTYYDLRHYEHDTFAWSCDRDAEAKRAMFPQLSDAFRKVCFRTSADGEVSSIFWAYARDEPAGEVFEKQEDGTLEKANM
ncbi:hypothetical protein B7494_g2564 [Chlorociboria aeruginascens]|nr:hypothetical protein B7494_g2564 [Chlorociboria aeruginascens]